MLRSISQHRAKDILRTRAWHGRRFCGTVHQAYSFCPRGRFGVVGNTKGTPLFYPVTVHNFRLYLSSGVERDLAFLAGLLSDVGVVILARAMATEYGPLASLYAPRTRGDFRKLESETVGVSHAEVGALALERWSLPNKLVLAVRHHHDDIGTIPENAIRLARLINGAGEIAGCLCEAPGNDDIREICCEAMRTAGIDISALMAILQAVEPEIEELAGLLRLDIVPSKVYALIAESVSEQISAALP